MHHEVDVRCVDAVSRSHHGVAVHVEHLSSNKRMGAGAGGVDAGQCMDGNMIPAKTRRLELLELKRYIYVSLVNITLLVLVHATL